MSRKSESVTKLFFRPFGARFFPTFDPRLAPWAAFFRRFAAAMGLFVPRLLRPSDFAIHSKARDVGHPPVVLLTFTRSMLMRRPWPPAIDTGWYTRILNQLQSVTRSSPPRKLGRVRTGIG